MRRIRWVALGLALLVLLVLVVLHGLTREAASPVESSSAALGLMLLEKERGLYVLAVTQGTPADRAGIHPGDFLIPPGEAEATGMAWLDALLASGEEAIPLTVLRDGERLRLLLGVK